MFTRRCYLMLHRQKEHGLLFKPVFDPQEIEKAEKEADLELVTEKEDGTANEFGNADQILVDPMTNMLVHVSEDGMVLEPLAEQPTFVGEFVEETGEPEFEEVGEEPNEKSPVSYTSADHSKTVRYVPSDIGLDLGSSEVVGVPLLEEELDQNDHNVDGQDMPILLEERKPVIAEEVLEERSEQLFPKQRVVNILKRKLPVRLPRE
ncbi:unnamed protein product [Cylicostephanus goldi]|uniref:Uncharacterized protein n=1 Tax=Cylicostephanus goldi TaxID=71465 RepID=A0A3P6SMI6_CYLGO|nr:unnamed protein product [Cylicostephanus goldi]